MGTAPTTELARKINLPLLTLYGIGTMLGAGVYVLIGKVAGEAGFYFPLAFLLAAVVASFSALSYSELASRFPEAGGEATYVDAIFSRRWLSAAVGWSIVATGVVSTATMADGFVGYLQAFTAVPETLAIVCFTAVLVAIAAWGVAESVVTAVVITLIEVAGVALVVGLAGESLSTLPAQASELLPSLQTGAWAGIASAAFLAFYAYIGFEDMVNMAEEVREPERVLPKAILFALVITTLIYVLVATVAVLALPPAELAASEAPFADIVAAYSDFPAWIIALVSLFAVANGALVQIIMAARVVYGMSRRGAAPAFFKKVNPRTRTPVRATVLGGIIVLILALALPLETLARVTSFIILLVFATVNVSLLWLKRSEDEDAEKERAGVRYPSIVPAVGALTCLGFIAIQVVGWLG